MLLPLDRAKFWHGPRNPSYISGSCLLMNNDANQSQKVLRNYRLEESSRKSFITLLKEGKHFLLQKQSSFILPSKCSISKTKMKKRFGCCKYRKTRHHLEKSK